MNLLSIQEAHDCSCAVSIDGEIIAAGSEERWSGLKGDYGFPKNAVEFCLNHANLKPTELDKVLLCSYNWNPVLTKIKRNANFSVADWVKEQRNYWYTTLFKKDIKINYYNLFSNREDFIYDDFYPMKHLLTGYMDDNEMLEMQKIRRFATAKYLGIEESKIEFVRHEDCHTAYAYYGSHINSYEGRERDCICLTCEGIGDYSNATYSYYLDDVRVEVNSTLDNNLGRLYQYMTLLLGMKPAQHEYKVMGLAPYSNKYEKDKSWQVFKDVMDIDERLCLPTMKERPKDLYFHFREALEGHRFDGIAAAVQNLAEYLGRWWVYRIAERVEKSHLNKIRKLVFSGGVAQNVKMNKVMAETFYDRFPFLTDFSVLPAAGDVSLPIGACYFWNHEQGNRNKPLKDIYLGPDEWESEEVLFDVIEMFGDKYKVGRYYPDNELMLNVRVAKLLSEGKIIARCSGRMEFGHRALGNRSILADPRNPQIVNRLNKAIKRRDFWMPFACTILREWKDLYIEKNYDTKIEDRFMTVAFDTTQVGREKLIAGIHPADYTIRPQVLDREDNEQYYDIISEFSKLTGVGAVLNTSFNLHGEPIVRGAKDALRVFESSDIDFLILGDYLVGKK